MNIYLKYKNKTSILQGIPYTIDVVEMKKKEVEKMEIRQNARRGYRIFLYVFLGISIGLFCWAAYTYYQNSVPDKIRIKAGTSEEIHLKIPASGIVHAANDTIVSLNEPITIVAGTQMDSYEISLKLFGVLPLKKIDIEVINEEMLIPVGIPIGIYLKTQGALVIDTGTFSGVDGTKYAPSQYKLQAGDYLIAMDGIAIDGKKQVQNYVEQGSGEEIIFQVQRKEEVIQIKVTPEKDEEGKYKIGIWLRDSAQGIGTMTYLDSENHFGALGHGINDMDTGELLNLGSGLLYETEIVAIQKGEKGKPGELTGIIIYQPEKVSGVIVNNTLEGIYGITTEEVGNSISQNALPVGLKQDVELGKAQIYCDVDGETKRYDIELIQISLSAAVNRQISFKVVDEDLIELTGGIVQGMSGAPIIQNGKFIGAVTHVLVDDPTRGYGIFIEDMLGH